VMVAQVVPVWSRQMEVTRDVATEGLAKLLDNFSGVSGALGELSAQLQSIPQSVDRESLDPAVMGQTPAMAALLEPSERAFRQRDEAVTVLGRCADALADLQQQAKAAHDISRHTRLVAFNASIEANRMGVVASGSQAVANELRDLAARMASTGEAVHKLVSELSQAVVVARRQGEIGDTSPEELRLELQIKARAALGALLGSVGSPGAGTRALQEASETLRKHLDQAFVNLQFGDRVGQMLHIVGNDMSKFAAWVARHPHATLTDAAEWLEALQANYTTEEQRAHHHGNVHVDRGSEVEYF
jgi:methyl-accepting chemotaxis protein